MAAFDPSAYGPAFAALLRDAPRSPLGPGRPDPARRPLLEALAGDDAFRPRRVADRRMADACRAGMWLLFDFLDESHAISQEISTAEGSYWHALLHRREPDFSNSAYWFRRVGTHAVFEPLRMEAARLAAGGPPDADFLTRQDEMGSFHLRRPVRGVAVGPLDRRGNLPGHSGARMAVALRSLLSSGRGLRSRRRSGALPGSLMPGPNPPQASSAAHLP